MRGAGAGASAGAGAGAVAVPAVGRAMSSKIAALAVEFAGGERALAVDVYMNMSGGVAMVARWLKEQQRHPIGRHG